jgi:hypothetical protein
MKIRYLLLLLTFACLGGLRAIAQLIFDRQAVALAWKNPEDESLKFIAGVTLQYFDGSELARSGSVSSGLIDSDEQADFLRFSAARPYFLKGETVSSNRPLHLHPRTGENLHNFVILGYDWEWASVFRTNIVSVSPNLAPDKTDVHVGFRDYLDAQPHYGWAHLRRASTNAGVAFFLVDWAVNPFPGQPIRAGEPPDLPQLTTVVDTATDPGNPLLRVSWPAGFPGVKLQTTTDLVPPVQWLDQELSGERLAVVAPPAEGQLFFRLVWAGL